MFLLGKNKANKQTGCTVLRAYIEFCQTNDTVSVSGENGGKFELIEADKSISHIH